MTRLAAIKQKWDLLHAGRGRAGGAEKSNVLFVLLLCLGPFFLCILFLVWNQAGHLERSVRIAAQQLETSESYLNLVHRIGRNQAVETKSIRDSASEFETSLGELEREIGSTQRLPPAMADISKRISEVRSLWDQLEAPLLGIADKPSADPQAVRLLRSKSPALVSASSGLLEDIGERRQVLRRWLLYTLTVITTCCLLILYSGLVLLKLQTRRVVRLIEGVVQRGLAGQSLHAPPLITREELAGLSGAFRGASASIARLLSLIDQRCRRAENLVNSVPSGLLVLSPDLRVLGANRFLIETLSLQPRELLGRSLQEVLPSAILHNLALHISDSRLSSQTVRVELPRDCGSRSLRVTLREAKSAEDPNARIFAMVEDVTELNDLRAAREESELRYHKLLENISEAVVLVDQNGLIIDMNAAAQELLGYARSEAAKMPLQFLVPENSPKAPEHSLVSLLSSGKWKLHRTKLESEFLRKDGTVFPAEIKVSSCRAGPSSFYVLSLKDISDYKRAELLAHDRLEVIELIAKNRPLETVLAALTQMIERQLPGSLCAVMLRQNDKLYPVAAPSLPEDYVQVVKAMPIGPATASCGTAAFEGTTVVVSDIATDPLWEEYRDDTLGHNLRACWSIPIFSSDGLIVGTIAAYNRVPRQPEASELELLQMASRLAGVSTEQHQLTRRLAYQAQHDALTGLANRYTFEECMRQAIIRGRRHKSPVGLLSVDLDRFKLINDTLGHSVGDTLLQKIAERIRGSIRETDIVARWGGDEFMVGLTELKDPEDASLVARKLLDAMKNPFEAEGHELFVTATIGISVYPHHGADLAALMRNADRAMYRAKNQGRNHFMCYTSSDGEAASRRLELEVQLRHALERDELLLNYQPQFELESRRLIGLEALLRWNHGTMGLVPPATFISIAEETGLIVPIGGWVLEQVCRDIIALRQTGCHPPRIAVNVSSLQFALPDFVELVAQTMGQTGIDPGCLELELTESMVMCNLEESTSRMARLRDLGVGIAIDDFGTGYSSLSYLQRLPIDTLKIDRSFVRDMTASSSTLPLVESIVTLARSLGMRTTAEGVETQFQLDALRTTGCQQAQGYLLGMPVPLADLLPVIAEPVSRESSRVPFLVTPPSPRHGGNGKRRRKRALPFPVPQPVRLRSADLSVL